MIVRHLAFLLLSAGGAMALTGSQYRSQIVLEHIQRVRSVGDVRAATSEDRFWAEYFDRQGLPLLEVKHVALLSGHRENGPVPPPPPGLEESYKLAPEPDRLQAWVCNTSAIVVGQPVAARAVLNRSETYLFTTYTVAVSDWIKPRAGAGTVSVALLGGIVQIGDEVFSARAASSPLIDLHTPVLLFLSRVPGVPRTLALHTPAVRLDKGEIVADYLPDGLESLATARSLTALTARLRAKLPACGEQK